MRRPDKQGFTLILPGHPYTLVIIQTEEIMKKTFEIKKNDNKEAFFGHASQCYFLIIYCETMSQTEGIFN